MSDPVTPAAVTDEAGWQAIGKIMTEFERLADPAADPPFFRGEKGEWDAAICDRIIETDDACDERGEYLIEWVQRDTDGGTVPVSGCCERHALDVDRRQVVRISTHPALVSS